MLGARSRLLPLFAGLLVGGFFAWLAIRGADLGDVRQLLEKRFDLVPALTASFCYLAYFILKSVRWSLILSPIIRVQSMALFPYMMVGYLGNLAVPFQLGEAYRGYLFSRDRSVSTVSVLSSIFLEKVFDLFVVIGLLVVAVQLADIELPFYLKLREGFLLTSLMAFLLLAFVLVWPGQAASLARQLIGWLPQGWLFGRLRTMLRHAVQGLAVLTSGKQAILVFLVSLLSWLLMLAIVYLSLQAVGLAGPVPMAAIILAFTVIGLLLPTSPGFVGTIQVAFVSGAQLFGVGQEQALASSIFYNAIITLPPILVGVVCIIWLHQRRRLRAGSVDR